MKVLGLFCVLLAPVFASDSSVHIDGQVFVVTGSGSATKLALAEVYFLTPAQVDSMKKTADAYRAAMMVRLHNYDADSEAKTAKVYETKVAKLREPVQEAERDLARKKTNGNARDVSLAEFKLSEERKTFDAYLGVLKANIASDAEAERRLFVEQIVAQISDARVAVPDGMKPTALTDAEGNFSTDSRPDAAVLITAMRSTGRKIEKLRWFLWVNQIGRGRVVFANQNMVGTDVAGQVLLGQSP